MRSFAEFIAIKELFGQMARKLYGHGGKPFIIGSVETPPQTGKRKKKRKKKKKQNRP